MNTQFAVVDCETTGVEDDDAAVEIAVVRLDDGAEFSSLVNPGRPIPPVASAVHHLTDADVVGAPHLANLEGELRQFIGDRTLVAHNAAFEGLQTDGRIGPIRLGTGRACSRAMPMTGERRSSRVIDALTAECIDWNEKEGLNLGSADEHLFDPTLTEAQRAWLHGFVRRWEEAEKFDRDAPAVWVRADNAWLGEIAFGGLRSL